MSEAFKFFQRTCPECGAEMEIMGDIRYEDNYWECPKCDHKKDIVIRG